MPYLGKEVLSGFTPTVKDSFNGDNSTTAFTLSKAVDLSTDIEVFVDNIQQEPGSGKAYTVSGTTLTFSEAPPTGTENVYVVHRNSLQGSLLPPQDLGSKNYNITGNLALDKDSAVLNFGADSDINITHVADTGLTTNGVLRVDSTTEATSTTDGSLQTDGGLSVAKDIVAGDDVKLLSDSAVLSFGADSEITLTHSADTGLILKNTNTGDDKPVVLTFQTGETDIAADDVLGKIDFQAPDEGTGVDAILVAASIEAVSEGDFSASSNATSLLFKTGSSAAATEGMRLTSGNATRQGQLLIGLTDPTYAVGGETDYLIVGNPSDAVTGMTFVTSSTGYTGINFSHGNSGNDRLAAYIAYDHNADEFVFGGRGNGTTLFKVDDSGKFTQFGVNSANNFAMNVFNDGDNTNRKGMAIRCGTDDASGTNVAISFNDGDDSGQGNVTFTSGTVTYGAFTAHHEISLPDADKSSGYDYGTLVEIDEIYYCKNRAGSEQERGIRYLVKKSDSAYSKKVLGAYCGDLLEVADKDIYYTEFDTIPSGKKVGDLLREAGTYKDNLHQAAVLGDGHIICNGEKGNISIGDGITTSSTAGIGMKADKLCMIVGIAQEDVTFSSTSETKLVPVQYGVRQFTPWT